MSAVIDALEAALIEAEDSLKNLAEQRDKHRQKYEAFCQAIEYANENISELKHALEGYDG